MFPRIRKSLFWIVLVGLLLAVSGCSALEELAQLAQDLPTPTAAPTVSQPADTQPTAQTLQIDPVGDTPATVPVQSDSVVMALEGTLAAIYERVGPSVVHIRHSGGEGSGFVWDTEGHIVSNNHVIAGAREVFVTFSDGTTTTAGIVGTDPDSDLAVLRVNMPPEQLRPVTMGDSTALRVGELAIAIGNPFGQEGTMTLGIISALGRRIASDTSLYAIPDVIQTDAAINPGNSGGVLLNPEGEVIGVTSAIISPVRASSGIGFAIPSIIVQRVVTALVEQGYYAHPYLGISGTDLTPQLAQARGLPVSQRGALLANVVPGSPADRAGLRGGERSGDIVIAVDGQTVNDIDALIVYLARYGTAGEPVTLTVLRDGQPLDVQVVLGERP